MCSNPWQACLRGTAGWSFATTIITIKVGVCCISIVRLLCCLSCLACQCAGCAQLRSTWRAGCLKANVFRLIYNNQLGSRQSAPASLLFFLTHSFVVAIWDKTRGHTLDVIMLAACNLDVPCLHTQLGSVSTLYSAFALSLQASHQRSFAVRVTSTPASKR